MLASYYAEVDIICVVILLCLIHRSIKSNFSKTDRTNFIVLLTINFLFVLSDFIWIFNNGYASYMDISNGVLIGYIGNGLNSILSALSSLSWLFFSESMQNHLAFHNGKKAFLVSLPVIILIILCLFNYQNHIMFTILNDGTYIRGIGYVYQVIVAFGYIIVAAILSLNHANKAKNEKSRKRSLTMFNFMIPPTIATVLQLLIPNMSILFIGTVLALLNLFISLQGQLVLNDPLTGLNNRSLLDQKIEKRMNSVDDDSDFYLLLFDADKFKNINDTFGHLEGDRALIIIADTLRKNCSPGDFICRYGGDEFIMLHKCKKNEDCSILIEKINKMLDSHDLPYSLHVSVGICKYHDGIDSWSKMVKEADESLYIAKKNR